MLVAVEQAVDRAVIQIAFENVPSYRMTELADEIEALLRKLVLPPPLPRMGLVGIDRKSKKPKHPEARFPHMSWQLEVLDGEHEELTRFVATLRGLLDAREEKLKQTLKDWVRDYYIERP